MIFVDSNVFVYAVGRSHPLRDEAQTFFLESKKRGVPLVTSAEVLQELLHVYLPVGRLETLDAALELAIGCVDHIFPIDADTVTRARTLADLHPGLTARDLLHLSVCQGNNIKGIKTFDRNLFASFKRTSERRRPSGLPR
jgi:predicted nucleic acid-binding protein